MARRTPDAGLAVTAAAGEPAAADTGARVRDFYPDPDDALVVDGLPAEQYHAVPALSASGARTLMATCPATYYSTSPLNPQAVREDRALFDAGTAAHLAILELSQIDARVCWIAFDDFKSKPAQQARDEARARGQVPLLVKHGETLTALRRAIAAHPEAARLLTGGVAERSIFWTRDGVRCKARLDYWQRATQIAVDLKTTTTVAPDALQRKIADLAYYQQVSWYSDAVEAAFGVTPERFPLVFVEAEAPHVVQVVDVHPRAVQWGHILHAKARAVVRECLAAGRWPGYRETAVTLDLPLWVEQRLEYRMDQGEFTV